MNNNNNTSESETLPNRVVVVPKLLKKSAGKTCCCIFRVPDTLSHTNRSAYRPRVVSIGPYHHGRNHLKMIEEHKHRFLEFFLSETHKYGVTLVDLLNAASNLEKEIRGSYSKDLTEFGSEKLIEMMVLDGCFVLTLFLVVAGEVWYTDHEPHDPIFNVPWLLPAIRSDLLLLENQIPLFLLQTLLQTSKLASSSSSSSTSGLNEIAFEFFDYSIQKPPGFWSRHNNLEAKHLLDLIRQTFVPVSHGDHHTPKQSCLAILCGGSEEGSESDSRPFLRLILSARKLRLRGITFKANEDADTPLDIRYSNGELHIPPLAVDDFISSVLLNCVAYEQFSADSTKHITSYVAFMGCLMNSEADAALLSEKGIIENYFGTEDEVSKFFKNAGKDAAFYLPESYLAEVFEGVNEYTSKGLHVNWAEFKHTHFQSPWTCVSSCAALTLLLLTVIQAFFAAFSYFRPPKD